jgi:deoxyribodipyrimidine photo-lyase
MSTSIAWFRQDLRLADNPALAAAVAGGNVVPVFIWSPQEEGRWPVGAAGRWWLHHALADLDAQLRQRGSRLIIRCGDTAAILRDLVERTRADRVVWNRRYEPAAVERDALVERELGGMGVAADRFHGSLLYDPSVVRTRSGGVFQVFTPFWEACLKSPAPGAPLAVPRGLPGPARWPKSESLAGLGLLPGIDWAGGIAETWAPTIAGAAASLRRFARANLAAYGTLRDQPAAAGTSRLSPYLHWGQLSPRQVWQAIEQRAREAEDEGVAANAPAYLRQLGWREFAYYLLVHFPRTPEDSLRPSLDRIRWRDEPRELGAWRQGRTGYPLVDAGMRQLWRTGWMHNRVRMVVASFLVKHLLMPWQSGAAWFWDTLVDADLANNTLGWQWTAGCGADAAPYFRVFNPTAQARKFDPDGTYIRRWVPELADRSSTRVHAPAAGEAGLFAGLPEGRAGYPRPIIEHAAARERFLSAVKG